MSFLGGESLRFDIPPGFTRIFDEKTTKGWHFSGTVHHGTTGIATVTKDGVLQLPQRTFAARACSSVAHTRQQRE